MDQLFYKPHQPHSLPLKQLGISRFGASPLEIKQVILPELAKFMENNNVRQIRVIEYNIWGNMFYPEWGETITVECFADEFGRDDNLIGGCLDSCSLGNVSYIPSTSPAESMGFRPLVVVSPKN